MNIFKEKSLYVTLTGLVVMGLIGSAQAVSLNPAGLGQVLIYPYYTVRGDASGVRTFNSLISVVNKTEVGKAVRVRFLEGKASQEVLDFNLYLSPHDVWTSAITPSNDGSGAMLKTDDKSCTSPPIPAEGVQFRNYLYIDANADREDATLDRTKEGYVEIIEMADIIPGTSTEKNVTHTRVNNEYKPLDCNWISETWGVIPAWVATDLTTGTGGLFGSMILINPNDAQDIAYEAVALDGFFSAPTPGANLWRPSGTIEPDLNLASPKISTVVNGTDEYITNWNEGIDAVSAVLMNASVSNEYVLEDSVAAKTDWIITMPTKKYYYSAPDWSKIRPLIPDYHLFQRDFTSGGACDELMIAQYNREESSARTDDAGGFPEPPPKPPTALCWGANVVTFGKTFDTESIFYAQNRFTLLTSFDNGWAEFTLSSDSHYLTATGSTQHIDLSTSPQTNTNITGYVYRGLPMVGFAVQQFNNGEVSSTVVPGATVWASYAGRIAHHFEKNIALP
ncbi:MAG: hypothetical protein FWF41_04545 [Betaproteobacteria bacterium]|nr:hypothetical protein [Betaproteobacteria bacterium]